MFPADFTELYRFFIVSLQCKKCNEAKKQFVCFLKFLKRGVCY